MTQLTLAKDSEAAKATRLDILVFIGSFIIGVVLYFVLRTLRAPQPIVTGTLVIVMLVYAVTVAKVPRLRVRFDQAGDNAYYLGLLFTLVSMAVALYEFRVTQTVSNTGAPERAAAIKIIGDFGIALATTISGIFLRVVLHQMRVDPSDVESATRIELAEAAKRVKLTLDSVSIGIGRVLTELQQRSGDELKKLVDETGSTIRDFVKTSGETSQKLIESLGETQKATVARSSELSGKLFKVAAEADAAMNRLKGIQGPPIEWADRLKTLSASFDALAINGQQAGDRIERAATSASGLSDSLRNTASELSAVTNRALQEQQAAMKALLMSSDQFATILRSMGEKVQEQSVTLGDFEKRSKGAMETALRVEEAAAAVLNRLVQMTRGLSDFVSSKG